MTVPVSELQKIAPSSIIELFVLELNTLQHGANDIYRFHAGANLNANGEVVWAGNAYLRFPIEADGFEYNGQGSLPRPKIRVSNLLGTITAILLGLPSGLEGAKVTRIRTLARYVDAVNFPGGVNPLGIPDPTAEFPREIYYIDRKTVENRDVVEFELAAAFDLQGIRAPKRQCIADICQWIYRSTECGYTGSAYFNDADLPVGSAALDVCGKRLTSCEVRFEIYTRNGSVVFGSNVVTLSSTQDLIVGDRIRGFGLPLGTNISAILSATTARVSNNATATTTLSVSGTPSATGASMTVTSATGLAIGTAVSGPYFNTQTVIGISGTTITLSERPYSFSRNGTYLNVNRFDDLIQMTDTTGITVGMRVFGSFAIDTIVTAVNTNTSIQIDTTPSPPPLNDANVLVYFMPASPAAATYTFSGNTSYVLRDPDAALPFGSFPGVGTFFS
jgi:lambda family phage minor tail protein L